jgi:hypothetical protein
MTRARSITPSVTRTSLGQSGQARSPCTWLMNSVLFIDSLGSFLGTSGGQAASLAGWVIMDVVPSGG